MKQPRYQVGSVFSPQLEDGRWGLGVVAGVDLTVQRGCRRVLSYGLKQTFERMPDASDLKDLDVTQAIMVHVTGDLLLSRGTWPVIEWSLPGFNQERWMLPPSTSLLHRGEPRPTKMSEQRLIICEPVSFNDVNIRNNNYVAEDKYSLIPGFGGLGDSMFFAALLGELMVRPEHNPSYIKITEESLVVWKICIERVRADGKFPSPRPLNPRPKPKPKKVWAKGPIDFWATIEAATQKSATAAKAAKAISKALAQYSSADVKAFATTLKEHVAQAASWELWMAAYLLNGGCSNDGFLYFRGWLIAQGREVFEQALKNPDSLATVRPRLGSPGEYEAEELLTAPTELLDWVYGEDVPLALMCETLARKKPSGKRWKEGDWADMQKRLPRLWKKYGAGLKGPGL